MALRTKTIEYSFLTRTTQLQAAGRHEFDDIDIAIPENSSRTFRSVIVEVTARQVDTSAVSMTAWTIGILLGTNTGSSFNNNTVTDTITNSGEHSSWVFTRDVTSYFSANYGSGTTQKCQVAVVFGAAITINITARLYITYEYDDTNQTTRIKTVRFPLESLVGSLTTSLQAIDSAGSVPKLNSSLVEASKVYRDIFFEISANEVATATTDFNLVLALDNEGSVQDGSHEQALNSSVWYRFIWKRTDMDTTGSHTFKAHSTVTSRFNTLCVVLVVTYEYNHSTSDDITNSLMIPIQVRGASEDSTDNTDRTRYKIELFIEELKRSSDPPFDIALLNSAVLLNFSTGGDIAGLNIKVGSQSSFRAYTHAAGSVTCGQFSVMHRFDYLASQGYGLGNSDGSIERGKHTATIDVYHTDTTDYCSLLGGVIYINYLSAKHADGDGAHNHTTIWQVQDTLADAVRIQATAMAPNIPESNYYVNSIGMMLQMMVNATSNAQSWFALKAEVAAAEDLADGWVDLNVDGYQGDAQQQIMTMWADASKIFARFPTDPDVKRLLIETSRKYRMFFPIPVWPTLRMLLTYHSILFKVSGAVYGSSNLTRVTVEAHRSDTGEKIGQDTVITDTTYQIPWYDDTIDVYAHAREADTGTEKVGRSVTGRAR